MNQGSEPIPKTPPNGHERELLIELMILRNGFHKNVEACKDRLKKLGTTWRDAKLLMTLVDKVQIAMLDTVPDKQFEQYVTLARKGRLRVDLPGPVHEKTYSFVSNDDLGVLTEYALRGECSMCMLSGKEARDCPLRQALLPVGPPEKVEKDYSCGCEYSKYASEIISGNEVVL